MDTCVACGEISEGKPLYKKLGNGGTIEVYDALIQMQLLALTQVEKNNHIICWDCDEIISEEYASFKTNEKKREEEEIRRKEADAARNQKLNKKLKQAFKKAYTEKHSARGSSPPVSRYKQKATIKANNQYYAQQCMLCNSPFKGSKSGYMRFSLKRMVDDSCSVYQALKKLGSDFDLEPHVQLRRFVCCICYNKIRRNYKDVCRGNSRSMSPMPQPYTNGTDKTVNSLSGIKRATADEHAAEIAKLLPPSLANVYKVVRQDEPMRRMSSSEESSDFDEPIENVQNNNVSKSDMLSNGVCCVCGLCYTHRPKIFWYSLSNRMPDYNETTVYEALQAVGTDLASVSKQTMDKGLVCKPCFTKVTSSYKTFRSQSQANGLDTSTKKSSIDMDMNLLNIINQSKHLRYKGRLVLLRSVDVHVYNFSPVLGSRSGRIATERLKDVYKFSNYYRSIRNKYDGKCIICLTPNSQRFCRWLEDPVLPPHLMVPLRWAKLSLGPSNTEANLSTDDGRVCDTCFREIKTEFMKFVSNKIGLSLNQNEGGKISLKTYKVSFDSVAMSVVADPLRPDEIEEEILDGPPMPKSRKKHFKKHNGQINSDRKKLKKDNKPSSKEDRSSEFSTNTSPQTFSTSSENSLKTKESSTEAPHIKTDNISSDSSSDELSTKKKMQENVMSNAKNSETDSEIVSKDKNANEQIPSISDNTEQKSHDSEQNLGSKVEAIKDSIKSKNNEPNTEDSNSKSDVISNSTSFVPISNLELKKDMKRKLSEAEIDDNPPLKKKKVEDFTSKLSQSVSDQTPHKKTTKATSPISSKISDKSHKKTKLNDSIASSRSESVSPFKNGEVENTDSSKLIPAESEKDAHKLHSINEIKQETSTSISNSKSDEKKHGEPKSLLEQLHDDDFCEENDGIVVAPFAQRKKIRTLKPPKQTEADVKSTYSCIWQTIQSISLDDLLANNELQPVKPYQYTIGLLLALDEIKDHIGGSENMVVDWMQKLLPKSSRDNGMKLNKPVVLAYLQKADKHLNKLSDPLPENFLCIQTNKVVPRCTNENEVVALSKSVEWFDALNSFNIDKLILNNSQPSTVIDDKAVYALWRIANMLNIPQSKWKEKSLLFKKDVNKQ